MLYDQLTLYSSSDAYTIVGSASTGTSSATLALNRTTSQLSYQPGAQAPPKADDGLTIYAVFGIITLARSDYLIVVTGRTAVARILGSPVYAATSFSVFPLSPTEDLLKHPEEAYLLSLVKSHLYSAPFYWSTGDFNVTLRMQEQEKNRGSGKPAWEEADDRFFWNRYLQSKLIDATRSSGNDYSPFIAPFMYGFFEFKTVAINGRSFLFGLISRRSRSRAGTRYFSRGIDPSGNVSNFNETEQVVVMDLSGGGAAQSGAVFSYVQTRGSVPVYWAEINNLRYKPDLLIMDLSSTAESLRRHFDAQISLYGDQYLVNLVNQKGYEKPVKEAYERGVQALANDRLHYTYFDFHHECKGLRFDRVGKLIDGMDEELNTQGYFYADSAGGQVKKTQSSVVRTNCMDCLDRTNVVQSALGKWVLNNQLREAGILSMKESIDSHAEFLSVFRNVWADNADVVSRGYSGTGALKTDYTRTGKRSKEGALQDGINSAIRYVKNNFLDGPRQDAYDLVTGAWVPRKGDVSWMDDDRAILSRHLPTLLLLILTVIAATFAIPDLVHQYASPPRTVFWLAVFAGLGLSYHALGRGSDFVAWPRLNRLDEILSYEGKGFESGRHGRPKKKLGRTSGGRRATKESLLGTDEKKRVD